MASKSMLVKSEVADELDALWPEWKIPLTKSKVGREERGPSHGEKIGRLMRIFKGVSALVRKYAATVPQSEIKKVLEDQKK